MLEQRTTEGIGWWHGDVTMCIDCSISPPSELWFPHDNKTIANREDECVECHRIFRDGIWLAKIERVGKDKAGNPIALWVDPASEHLCTVNVQTLGYFFDFHTETPLQASTLYEALLQVTEISAD